MHRRVNIKLKDLTYLVCKLCSGYLIDPVTLKDCPHSFCKSCLVRHVETNLHCPVCGELIHKTRPLLNVRPDPQLQRIVYKLVPSLYKNEMQRRRDFYKTHHDEGSEGNQISEDRGNVSEDHLITSSIATEPTPELSICIRKIAWEIGSKLIIKEPYDDVRYLLCPPYFTIDLLKKFLRNKLCLSNNFEIGIFYSAEFISDFYSLLDIAELYSWRRVEPLNLFYVIWDSSVTSSKKIESGLRSPDKRPTVSTAASQPSCHRRLIRNPFRVRRLHRVFHQRRKPQLVPLPPPPLPPPPSRTNPEVVNALRPEPFRRSELRLRIRSKGGGNFFMDNLLDDIEPDDIEPDDPSMQCTVSQHATADPSMQYTATHHITVDSSMIDHATADPSLHDTASQLATADPSMLDAASQRATADPSMLDAASQHASVRVPLPSPFKAQPLSRTHARSELPGGGGPTEGLSMLDTDNLRCRIRISPSLKEELQQKHLSNKNNSYGNRVTTSTPKLGGGLIGDSHPHTQHTTPSVGDNNNCAINNDNSYRKRKHAKYFNYLNSNCRTSRHSTENTNDGASDCRTSRHSIEDTNDGTSDCRTSRHSTGITNNGSSDCRTSTYNTGNTNDATSDFRTSMTHPNDNSHPPHTPPNATASNHPVVTKWKKTLMLKSTLDSKSQLHTNTATRLYKHKFRIHEDAPSPPAENNRIHEKAAPSSSSVENIAIHEDAAPRPSGENGVTRSVEKIGIFISNGRAMTLQDKMQLSANESKSSSENHVTSNESKSSSGNHATSHVSQEKRQTIGKRNYPSENAVEDVPTERKRSKLALAPVNTGGEPRRKKIGTKEERTALKFLVRDNIPDINSPKKLPQSPNRPIAMALHACNGRD